MTGELNTENHTSLKVTLKVKDYLQLMKFTLSFTVVFSCVICYLLVPGIVYDWARIILLFIAGMLVTGSANTINQAAERDTDALMKRTATRPVASGRMSANEAYGFAFVTGFIGVWMMYMFFNAESALLSLISLLLYAFVYTPLKKINSLAVLVGALPGALPCLIGWVAGTGIINPFATLEVLGQQYTNMGGWVLFAMQFLWQFPHFWAIAWVAHTDYSKAGFKLLPSDKGPTRFTALQTVIYAILMVPVGMLPYRLGISGQVSLFIVFVCNLFIVFQCVRLYIDMDVKAARRVMFSSYIYLPIVLLALLADKM